MAILFVIGLFIGVFAGYFIGMRAFGNLQAQDQGTLPGQNSGSGIGQVVTKQGLFATYAQDLGLDTEKFETCLNNDKYAGQVNSDLNLALAIGIGGTPFFVINNQYEDRGAVPYSEFQMRFDAELENASNRSVALGLIGPNDPTIGKKGAPIIMVEFSDYQCPYCAVFWKNSLPQIKKDYIDAGKVLFVYKNFPLKSRHSLAQKSAEAALCAGEQGKYWEYHDKLFSNQIYWGS